MTPAHAIADIFTTAFHGLSREQKNIVIANIFRDRRLRRDLIDIALAEKRSAEPKRSFRKFLKKSRKYSS